MIWTGSWAPAVRTQEGYRIQKGKKQANTLRVLQAYFRKPKLCSKISTTKGISTFGSRTEETSPAPKARPVRSDEELRRVVETSVSGCGATPDRLRRCPFL